MDLTNIFGIQIKEKKKDYFYLKTVYENNLKYLTKTLNLIHNEKNLLVIGG